LILISKNIIGLAVIRLVIMISPKAIKILTSQQSIFIALFLASSVPSNTKPNPQLIASPKPTPLIYNNIEIFD